MKKHLVFTCMSFALSLHLIAEKGEKFSIIRKYDSMVKNYTPKSFVQLQGEEEAKARKYFDKLKQERKNYYLRNKEKYGRRFTLSYDIALSASRMMEKFFNGEESFKAGLKCFHKLSEKQDDVEALAKVFDSCRQKLSDFRMRVKEGQIKYHAILDEEIPQKLMQEIHESFTFNKEASNYLARVIPPEVKESGKPRGPEMDCHYHGGSFTFALIFGGFSGTGHHFKCRTKLGRKVVYKVASGAFSLGLAATFSYKKARFFQNEDGSYRRKTFPLPYSELRRARFFNSVSGTAAAVAVGVTGIVRNLGSFMPDSKTFGIGGAVSFGSGGIIKDKKHMQAPIEDQDHDFRKLFEVLGLEFS